MAPVTLTVNNQTWTIEAQPDTPLLWVLRDTLGLTGTKYGCGIGICGACIVHLDGRAAYACLTPVSALAGQQVTTIEGLSANSSHPLQQAWLAENVSQCGYCQSGQIMRAAALLAEYPQPTTAEIESAMAEVICRCGTYQRIRQAINRAVKSQQMSGQG